MRLILISLLLLGSVSKADQSFEGDDPLCDHITALGDLAEITQDRYGRELIWNEMDRLNDLDKYLTGEWCF